jgi:hypothetical protein
MLIFIFKVVETMLETQALSEISWISEIPESGGTGGHDPVDYTQVSLPPRGERAGVGE